MSATPRPGWYPDPAGTADLYRWWDGGGWTDAISESPRAPSPRTSLPADDADDLTRRRPSRFRAAVALLVCLALFLSATVGLGLIIWHDPPSVKRGTRLPTGAVASPSTTLPSASPGMGWLDERTRVARIGTATMRLPPPPYVLPTHAMTVSGLLEVFFLADAPVHPGYDGAASWSSAVLLARLPGTAAGSDLRICAEQLLQGLSRTLYQGAVTRLDHVVVADHAVDGRPGVRLTARVHYDIARLPSRYDDLTAVLVGLDDGSVMAAVSSVPDDARPTDVALARSALRSLEVG